jgi:hypothetical protein
MVTVTVLTPWGVTSRLIGVGDALLMTLIGSHTTGHELLATVRQEVEPGEVVTEEWLTAALGRLKRARAIAFHASCSRGGASFGA